MCILSYTTGTIYLYACECKRNITILVHGGAVSCIILHICFIHMCHVCLDIEIATTAAAMAAGGSAKKGKLNIDDKVKSKKYNHSFVKDIVGKGKT